jgi:hypothetical protein
MPSESAEISSSDHKHRNTCIVIKFSSPNAKALGDSTLVFKNFIYGLKGCIRHNLVRTIPGTYVSLAPSRKQVCTLLLFVSRLDRQKSFLTYSLTVVQTPPPLQRHKYSPQYASFLFPSTDTNFHSTRVCIADTGGLSASR